MSDKRPPEPFKVDRDGIVTHRESGTMVGRVRLDPTDGWTALGLGDEPINKQHWNGRKYAARVVWEASPFYVPRATYQHQPDAGTDSPGSQT